MDARHPDRRHGPPMPSAPAGSPWPTIEVDLRERRPAEQTGAKVPTPRGSWPRRLATIACVCLTLAAAMAVLFDADGAEPDRADHAAPPLVVERPDDPPGAVGRTAGDVVESLASHEVATLAVGAQVSGGSHRLALFDADGLRFVDLDEGTVTDPAALGPLLAPIAVSPDGDTFVFVARSKVREVDVQGRRRVIGAAHGAVVGVDDERVWMLDRAEGDQVLTAVARSSGAVLEHVRFAAGDAFVGFHDGRPLVTAGDVVVSHEPDDVVRSVTRGEVVATGGTKVLVRRCLDRGCGEAVIVDLADGAERTVALAAGVRAFGLGDALSPDGRWLVGLEFPANAQPRVALYPLDAPDADTGPPVVLSVGVLGYGGRAAGLTWSPDGALLAAPGSSGVALVDIERRTTVTLPIRLSGSGPTVRWLSP